MATRKTTDIDRRMLIGDARDATRYEDWRTNPRPLRDGGHPFVKQEPLASHPANPLARDAEGRYLVTGQVRGSSAAHTGADVPLSAFGPGAPGSSWSLTSDTPSAPPPPGASGGGRAAGRPRGGAAHARGPLELRVFPAGSCANEAHAPCVTRTPRRPKGRCRARSPKAHPRHRPHHHQRPQRPHRPITAGRPLRRTRGRPAPADVRVRPDAPPGAGGGGVVHRAQ